MSKLRNCEFKRGTVTEILQYVTDPGLFVISYNYTRLNNSNAFFWVCLFSYEQIAEL